MLEEILNNIHNFFVVPGGVHRGTFSISSGTTEIDGLQDGQFFRIVGSVFNDGVHRYPDSNLTDETFTGEIWFMAVPPALLALANTIEEWRNTHQPTEFVSEAFGGYSYTRGTNGNTGVPMGWQDVFRGQLNAWRKIG